MNFLNEFQQVVFALYTLGMTAALIRIAATHPVSTAWLAAVFASMGIFSLVWWVARS